MKYAILAENVRKSFPLHATSLWSLWLGLKRKMPCFDALNQINLRVPKGEMLGVIGGNGAGKSTLLRTLSGVYTADAGRISVNGPFSGLFELGGGGNQHMNGHAYALRYFQMHAIPRRLHAALLDDIERFAELGEYFHRPIRTYSAGMMARLYFAVATATHKDIYFIDEILSVGDEHFQVKSWSRIRDRLARGVSGILVTHDWSAVIKLCRRACILEKGRIIREGKADEVIASYLQLPLPVSEHARLIVPPVLYGDTGTPLRLTFEVELEADIAVELSVAIEYLMLGLGWEVVLLHDYSPLAQHKGRHRITLTLPHTPLKPGNYMLSLFLATPADPATGARTHLHAFSWTYGNGCTLTIGGEDRPDLAPFPVSWKQVHA